MFTLQRATLVTLVACGALGARAVPYVGGDSVWFEGRPNAWKRGTIEGTCAAGFRVKDKKGQSTCRSPHLLAPDQSMDPAAIGPGSRVLAPWSNGRLYAGRVAAVLSAGQVRVEFDDGDAGTASASALRSLPAASAAGFAGSTGSRVWVQRRPNQWGRGTVRGSCAGGTRVRLEGGSRARCLGPGLIAEGQLPPSARIVVGTRVLALWRDARMYPATVVAVDPGESYRLRFDDGALDVAGRGDLRRIGP